MSDDNYATHTPKQIAKNIFSKAAEEPLSKQLFISEEGSDLSYIFEIMLTILVEGLDIFTKGLNVYDLSSFSEENITMLNPWMNSMGFKVKAQCVEEEYTEEYSKYYCRVILNKDEYKELFVINEVENVTYHFLLNGTFLDENKKQQDLDKLFAIFINNEKVYKISFNFFIPTVTDNKTKIL